MKDKSYFVLTTNVDYCFQKAGFDKNRLFYTQGDYGLFQCSKPCHYETYDNEENIRKMVISQGFDIRNGELIKPEGIVLKMAVQSEFVPKCPKCGRPMSMNLRSDNHLLNPHFITYVRFQHKKIFLLSTCYIHANITSVRFRSQVIFI